MKKILVIPSDPYGCGKFRCFDPHVVLQSLYNEDFDVDVMFPRPNVARWDIAFKPYDMIFFHKELDKECNIIKIAKYMGKKIVVDIDDHFDLGNDHPMSITAKLENWKQPIINHLMLADAVTTTTPIFAKTLKKYNKNVYVLPNAINPKEEQFIHQPIESKRLRLGIVCGSTHLEDIKMLQGMISMFSKEELDNLQFVLCGFDTRGTIRSIDPKTNQVTSRNIEPHESVWARYEEILTDNYSLCSQEYKDFLLKYEVNKDYENIENEIYRRCWTKDIASYGTHYNNIDVLLVPLKDNEFNKMKSQLKVIESGFHKIPIIASNFGPYTIDLVNAYSKGTIDLKGNSLLVEPTKGFKQWAKMIKIFLKNRDLVKTLGENLYETVKDKYSLETVTKQRALVYQKILES